jgi:hypothetical protein
MDAIDLGDEVMAALNLTRAELASVGRASQDRLARVASLLAATGVTAARSIRPSLVRAGKPSLLDLLRAETLDDPRIVGLLVRYREHEDAALQKRLARELWLRGLGFE